MGSFLGFFVGILPAAGATPGSLMAYGTAKQLSKNPETYGAFPSDPYSHTPGNAGAQQPGMTGQVKEDILARWGELGVTVSQGRIVFQPLLLRKAEFLSQPASFVYYDVAEQPQTVSLEADTLAFTYCQVPVVYRVSDAPKIRIRHRDGRVEGRAGLDKLNVPRSTVPAVTHVDYSARVQTVTAESNGRYYRLLKRFNEQTGCPVIVNTSFNIRGEPVVCTPKDAWRCFMGTQMDALVLENTLLIKEEQPDMSEFDVESYKASFQLD